MRHKNAVWAIPDEPTWDQVKIALLMDIRDEIQILNRILNCHNFLRIPHVLDQIRRNTKKVKRATKKTA